MSGVNVLKAFHNISKPLSHCLVDTFYVPSRNTFILRRKFPPPLSKLGGLPKHLKGKQFIYELVEDLEVKKSTKIPVILTHYVEGVGHRGDVLEIKRDFARNSLLLPKLAIYATPENLEKSKDIIEARKRDGVADHSSKFAPLTMKTLSKTVVFVSMNANNPWIVEKWHIALALRQAGVMAPDYTIELPSEPISGPDKSKQMKDFAVFIKINNFEHFPIRCRLYHWSPNPLENDEITPEMYETVADAIFPEQEEILRSIPKPEQPDTSPSALQWKR